MLGCEAAEVAAAVRRAAGGWVREQGMTRSLGPFSLSIWDEPGLLIEGHDHPPSVMMGHNSPAYQAWVESAGYAQVQDLYTYDLDITQQFPPLIQRIVSSGERNAHFVTRRVNKKTFNKKTEMNPHNR